MENCQRSGYIVCFDRLLVCAQMLLLTSFYFLNLAFGLFFFWFPSKNLTMLSTNSNNIEKETFLDERFPINSKNKGAIDNNELMLLKQGSNTTLQKKVLKTRLEWWSVTLSFCFLILLLGTFTILGIFFMMYFGKTSLEATTYAYIMGYIATTLTFVQWGPQIIRILWDRSTGNFSIVMIAIMTPFSFSLCDCFFF